MSQAPLPFQVVSYDYLGGVQTAKPITKFNNDDAILAIGGNFDKRGAFEKRKGGIKYNNTSLNQSGRGLFDFRFNSGVQQKLLIFGQDTVWEGNTGSPTPILTGQSDARYSAVKVNIGGKDFAFWSNGLDRMRKYDGTTVTFASIFAPSTIPVATPVIGAGTLAAGTYQIAVTFLNADDEESNPSDTITVTLTGGQNTINLTALPVSTDPQVTARRIYMSLVDGAVLFGNLDVANNTATTATILVNSNGALLEYDHDDAPNVQYLRNWSNRLVGAGDPNNQNILYLSKEFDVWHWPQGVGSATDYRIQIGNGDAITGIKDFQDVLIVTTEAEVWVLSGAPEDGSLTLTKVKADERSGCASNWTMEVIEGFCWYVGRNSVYRTNGYEIQDVGWCLSSFFSGDSIGTINSRFQIHKSRLDNAVGISIKSKPHNWYLFSCDTESDVGLNRTSFLLDYTTIRADQGSNRFKVDVALWSNQPNLASTIVVTNNVEYWYSMDNNGYVFINDLIDGDGAQTTSYVTSATTNTLTDTAQSWSVNQFAGLYVRIISGAGSSLQTYLIASNTADTLTLVSTFAEPLDTTSRYSVGSIEYDYQHKWDNYSDTTRSKRWRYFRPRFETSGNFPIEVIFGFDFDFGTTVNTTLPVPANSLWDSAQWDVDYWDASPVVDNLIGVVNDHIHRWSSLRIRNLGSGEGFLFASFDKIYQTKGLRP